MKQKTENKKPASKGVSVGLDARMTELVAIGASVAGHCQPCLAFHVNKAKELGVEDSHVQAAIAVGHMVEKGAMAAMREFAKSTTGTSAQEAPACCGGTSSKDGKKCCG